MKKIHISDKLFLLLLLVPLLASLATGCTGPGSTGRDNVQSPRDDSREEEPDVADPDEDSEEDDELDDPGDDAEEDDDSDPDDDLDPPLPGQT